ncbi:unnamed protein product [Rotaria sp. Silwood1]|nr:unnamed protein product [Rotaria sp. Silwood1]CAF3699669.1 unnamed protein product [Rotaria sp. Silwood1]CAF3704629.1 unnamed protein product [Rotaria sp. Silwood1]CAF4716450.1 unnamed protein product [Rotaria sp. Silwood1]CAF4876727.1 unnamed protein product [Rotaria sp. Silwood1]
MAARFWELERRTLIVQYVGVQPLQFYATSDGTDLVQDILRKQLARSNANIFGQEGSLSINDNGEFLTFEPTDTQNRTLHLPIEHLAFCGALRRMRREPSDQRNPDQIIQREFENVDLANRYAQYIIGPPILVAIFHGFDNALCYTFITQSADDACLSVMKLMRAFRQYEQQQEEQGQINQGLPLPVALNCVEVPSPVVVAQGCPVYETPQIASSTCIQLPKKVTNMYVQNPCQDDFVQNLLCNPNFQIINQPCSSSTPVITQCVDRLPIISAPVSSTQQYLPVVSTMLTSDGSTHQFLGGSVPMSTRPPSPPIIGIPHVEFAQNLPSGHNLPPKVVHMPNNQEVTYKQNIIIRWLKPPTPPPPAPIIIREIQCQPEIEPPIICRQVPQCPPTPPPIIVREQPPPCPPPVQPIVIENCQPPPCLPRQVIFEQCPPPPPKPQTIIYEKCVSQPPQPIIYEKCVSQQQPRPIIVKREYCPPPVCNVVQQKVPCRRVVQEVIRQVPQPCTPARPALVCTSQQQEQITPGQSQMVQQLVPVFATRRHIVQPKGIRVIRQVIGPAQPMQ